MKTEFWRLKTRGIEGLRARDWRFTPSFFCLTSRVLCLTFISFLATPGLCQALTATNLSVYPNPISPALYDSATISFILSEDPTGATVEVKVGTNTVTPTQAYTAGMNVVKWTPGADGTYDVKVYINGSPVTDGKIVVDSQPPKIDNVSIAPTPFSPNKDGINDYVEINFTVSRTSAEEGDLGVVEVQNPGPPVVYNWTSGPDNSEISNVTGARLAVAWFPGPTSTADTMSLTINGSYKRAAYSSDLELKPGVYDVTDEFYTYLDYVEIGTGSVVGDTFAIYWIAGNATVDIFSTVATESGELLESLPAQPIFTGEVIGSGEYFVRWGGKLEYPDGRYVCRIQATDAAGNISRQSGIIVIDSEPIRILMVSLMPEFKMEKETISKISPETKDGLYDSVIINYFISEAAYVTAKIYDSDMNQVCLAKAGQEEKKGNGQVVWSGLDQGGNVVSPGSSSSYTCVITAVDSQTYETAEIRVLILVDNTSPGKPVLASADSPTNATEVTIVGVAEPGSMVEIRMNGIPVGKASADIISGKFSQLVSLTPGRKEITAQASDDVGNKGPESDPIQVLVDRIPPTVTDTVPAEWKKAPVSVTLKAKDEAGGSGVSMIHAEYYAADGSSGSSKFPAPKDANGNYPVEFQATMNFNQEGIYNLMHYAVDAASNAGNKVKTSNPIRIDTTMPAASITRIFGDNWEPVGALPEFDNSINSPSLMVEGSASDSLSGVSQIMVSITKPGDPDAYQPAVGTATWFYSFSPGTVISVTSFNLNVKVIDNAGNESVSVVPVALRFTPPATQEAVATELPGGRIRLTWPGTGAPYNIYRSTSPFSEIDETRLWVSGVTGNTWVDGQDNNHPTTDGTEYYYLINGTNETYIAQAIADKTTPSVENIVAVPSPFSPDGDRIEDSTEIFFTLTETTSVALNVYRYATDGTMPLIRKLLPRELFKTTSAEIAQSLDQGIIHANLRRDFASKGGITLSQNAVVFVLDTGKRWTIAEENDAYTIEKDGTDIVVKLQIFPTGDNFVQWDGTDDSGTYVAEGRYLYRFEASETMDIAGNTLRQRVSGDVWVLLAEFKLEDISVTPTPFSPDGDKVRDVAFISYVINGDADYVAANIFSIKDGQQRVISRVYAECLDYYWDIKGGIWTPFHVNDGIRKGLSTERYYLKPINDKDPKAPPFHTADPLSPPANAQTIQAYLNNYQTDNPNWVPVPFTLRWDGAGAETTAGASTYIIRLEAVKLNGAKTLPKTHEIVVENPRVVPNDKTPPVLKSTIPPAGTVYKSIEGLSLVQAFLSDGQGTGVDLVNSTISLVGPDGATISGQVANDGKTTLTLHLDSPLAADGSEDGMYTIVVVAVDYAKNQSSELRSQFSVKTEFAIDDNQPPFIDDVFVKTYPIAGILPPQNAGPICLGKYPYLSSPDSVWVKLVDEKSGIDTELSFLRLIEPDVRLLFSVTADVSAIRNSLDSGSIPDKLRTAFPAGLSLSATATVIVEEETHRWFINDAANNRLFTVKREFSNTLQDAINVYTRLIVNGELKVEEGTPYAVAMGLDWAAPLSVIGWYTLDVFAVDNVRRPLSTIELSGDEGDLIVASLDHGIVPNQCKTKLSLSENAAVLVKDSGCVWIITDQGQGKLGLYNSGGCRWRVIGGQKIYVLEKKVSHLGDAIIGKLHISIGNAITVQIPETFFFDNVSPVIGPITVNNLQAQVADVSAIITDSGSGINSKVTSIVLKDRDGNIVPGSLRFSEEKRENERLMQVKVIWLSEKSLQTSGTYTLEIHTQDRAGNDAAVSRDLRSISSGEGIVASRVYFVFPEAGELYADEDEAEAKGDKVFNLSPLNRVTVRILSASQSGIDYQGSTIKVIAPKNAPEYWDIKGFQTDDEAAQTITFNFKQSLATDGRGDGKYKVKVRVKPLESTSGPSQEEQAYYGYFTYDTQPPAVDKVEIGSRPWVALSYEPISGLKNGGTSRSLARVDVKLKDNLSSIDLFNSIVEIIGPNGALESQQSNDGTDTLILDFPTLAKDGKDDGVYTINITAVDSAGNSSEDNITRANQIPYSYSFIYDTTPPQMISADIADGNQVYPAPSDPTPLVLSKVEKIRVKLADNDAGVGVDIPGSADTIFVFGPRGQIEGKRDYEGRDTIVFKFNRALSTANSTDDGIYTVKASAIDLAGNQKPVEFTFQYKAIAPLLVDVQVITDDGQVFSLSKEEKKQFQSAVTQVRAILKDRSGKGLDFEASILAVAGPGVSRQDTVANNDVDAITYTFTKPLANDGTDDGVYQVLVRAMDKDGHWADYIRLFFFDSVAPRVVSTTPADGAVITPAHAGAISEVSAKLADETTAVDLFKSRISLKGPATISATQVNDGVDTIKLKFLPLAGNGTADGRYEISVNPVDILGNELPEPLVYRFVYDTKPPALAATVPSKDELVTGPVERVIAFLTDGMTDESAGVDENACSLILTDPKGKKVDGSLQKMDMYDVGPGGTKSPLIVLSWDSVQREENSKAYYVITGEIKNLSSTLKKNVSVNVTSYDANGSMINTKASNPYENRLISAQDIVRPDASVTPQDIPPGEVANFVVWLERLGGEESFKVRPLYYDPEEKKGDEREPNAVILAFILKTPLAVDGTADGTYTISVVTQDMVGNRSAPVVSRFVYSTVSPTVSSTRPTNGAQFRIPISSVKATLKDNSGVGLDSVKSAVTLLGPGGNPIAGKHNWQEPDTAVLTLDNVLATDGTADGVYTMEILASDRKGVSTTYRATFVYDTTPPVVKSWMLDAGYSILDASSIKYLASSIKYVSVQLEDAGSGVDLEGSKIELAGPGGSVKGIQVDDGVNTIKYKFAPLPVAGAADGRYTISVIPKDKVGNAATEPQTYSFIYDTSAPIIKQTEPAQGSTVTVAYDRVSVLLEDVGEATPAFAGAGIDFKKSEIYLYGPDGKKIPGVKDVPSESWLILTFPALAVDGSRNGKYTVNVVAYDLTGNTKEYSFGFTYLPTAPRLASVSPENGSYLSTPVKQITAKLEDKSKSGIDFENSWIKLTNPKGQEVKGQMSHNATDTLFFYLQYPLATDGTADGGYNVEIKVVDKKKGEAIYKTRFTWDTTPPKVESVSPADGSALKGLSEVKVKLSDATPAFAGAGVDLFASVVTLKGPVTVAARQVNNGVDTISLVVGPTPGPSEEGRKASLPDGSYEISVNPVDILGNKPPEPYRFSFRYDTRPPALVSTEPSSEAVVTGPVKRVTAVLSDGKPDETAGIDLGACSLTLIGPDGEPVKGELTRKSPNTLNFEPTGFTQEDSRLDDGIYTINVMTQDLTGNRSAPILVSFTCVTKAPALLATIPAEGAQIRDSIGSVKAILKDNSGTGLDSVKSKVTLLDPDDRPIAGKYNWQEPNTAVFTLGNVMATDGTADGVYTLEILAADKAGTSFSYKTRFVYDTTPPKVKNTTPGVSSMVKESLSYVSVQLEDAGSGVDLEGSKIELIASKGSIKGAQVNDGVNTIKYKFAPLPVAGAADGRYTISVIPKDKVGNAAVAPQTFSFVYDTSAPVIKQTEPADGSMVVVALNRVSVLLEDAGEATSAFAGAGVDTQSSGIRLYSPSGRQIPGVREDSNDSLILTFPILAIDGRDNGKYTVAVVTQDRAGNISKEYTFSFTYLPTAPSLLSVNPENGSYLSTPVKQIVAKLEDKSKSGINFENSWIKLTGDMRLVSGRLSNDGVSTMILGLQNPFATDGRDDGRYSVEIKVVDKKKNEATYKSVFLYDTTPCIISAVYVGVLELNPSGVIPSDFGIVSSITAVVKDAGAGADLGSSQISLVDPSGKVVDAKQHNNGVDTIGLEFDPIKTTPGTDGVYTVLVDATDKLGNKYPKAKTYSFMVDTAAPKVAASTPADGSMVVSRKLSEVNVQLDDGAGSGIDTSRLSIEVSGPNGKVKGTREQGDTGTRGVYNLLYKFDAPLSVDGKDDGDYVIKVQFADKAGNTGAGMGAIHFTYDTVQPGGPVISNLGVFPKAFSPNGDAVYDRATISYVLSKDAKVRLMVYDSNRALAGVLLDSVARPAGVNSVLWDGTAPEKREKSPLPDGMYIIKIDAVDSLGLTGAVESSSVIIDTRPPSVDRVMVSDNPFTPDGDGFADTTTISFDVIGSEKVEAGSELRDSVAVAIYAATEKIASPGLNRNFDGDGKYSVTWNGEGAKKDGEYSFTITARDSAGNMREVSGTVALDKSGPSIELLNPSVTPAYAGTNQSPIVISGRSADWSGVRSVSLMGVFTPSGAKSPVDDPINNWVNAMFSGDKVDNDGDGRADEEKLNGFDDDGDKLIDEDLAGKERISDPVDWIYRLVPQADGEYQIRIRASDSIVHTSLYPQVLKVVYDKVPPRHVSTVVKSTPGPSQEVPSLEPWAKNGDTLILVTTWDEPGYKITVDFTRLDSAIANASGPIKADDQGNGTYTVAYKVSEKNTQSDGSKNIVITAEDAVGNRTVLDAFRIRLRNKLPTIVSVSSDARTFANGALVKISVECDAPDLMVSADLSKLDSTYTPGKVKVTNNGQGKYLVEYTIGGNNTVADKQDITIIISASDGSESVSSEYKVSLDNTGPEVKSVKINRNGLESTMVRNGDKIELEMEWNEPVVYVSADFGRIDSAYRPGSEIITKLSEFNYIIQYGLSSANKAKDGEDKKVVITAQDLAGNKSQYDSLLFSLDNTAPAILSVASSDADKVYKNTDTVTLLVKLDAKGYEVSADFSMLDSEYPAGAKEAKAPVSNSDGTYTYTLVYAISRENKKALSGTISNIRIPVTATDPAGNTSTDSSMTLELDNFPPKLEIESPASDSVAPASAEVNTARIEIKGQTEPGASIKVNSPAGGSSLDKEGKFICSVVLSFENNNLITVTASDVAGNQTTKTLTVIYRPVIRAAEGGTIYLPEKKDDGIEGNDTRVVVPPKAIARDFSIEITQLESAPQAVDNPDIGHGTISPLAAYEFVLKDADGAGLLSMTFTKPISIYLQYQGLSKLDGPAAVFRWDGVRWNRIGGAEDRKTNTVKIAVNSLSIFGVFKGTAVKESASSKLRGASPNPFTPNGDGINDAVSFYFDNSNNAKAVVRIFDLRGALIRKLESGLTSWDGRDDSGETAETGIYIYQVEVVNKAEGGTIVLAK